MQELREKGEEREERRVRLLSRIRNTLASRNPGALVVSISPHLA